MPLLSSAILLRTVSLYHLTLAFYLLTSPSIISTHPLVSILGASLNIPPAIPTHYSASSSLSLSSSSALSSPNAATGLLAIVFAYWSLTDFTAAGLRDEVYHEFWGAQTPMRMVFLFILEAWMYLTKPDYTAVTRGKGGVAEWIRNDVVFSWGFIELVWMFWVCSSVQMEIDGKLMCVG